MAADYASWSPYNYVLGNPIRLIDPDGRAPKQWPPVLPVLKELLRPKWDAFVAQEKVYWDHDVKVIRDKYNEIFGEGDATKSGSDLGDVGEGVTVLSNSDKKSTRAIGTSNGKTSTAIIETGELLNPRAGNAASFAKNIIGQPVNFIKNAVDATDNMAEVVNIFDYNNPKESGPPDTVNIGEVKFKRTDNGDTGIIYKRLEDE